jgi:hypothetical protein
MIQSWRVPMQPIKPSSDAERPDENPYAPPQAEPRPEADKKRAVQADSQRKEHLRRESCIRATGLLCLIIAVIVILTFGLGTLSELRRIGSSGEEGIEPWMHRRWIARMTSVISLAVIAAFTSWGLFRLRNWGRLALTIVTTLPVPAPLCGWLLLNRTANPGLEERPALKGLILLSAISALSSLPSLFLMWSPKGQMVFSPEYRETIRQTPDLRPGCSGLLPTLVAAPAGFVSYSLLMVTVLTILVMLGLIRSF